MTIITIYLNTNETVEIQEIKNRMGMNWENTIVTCMAQTEFLMDLANKYGLGDITDLKTSQKIADAIELYSKNTSCDSDCCDIDDCGVELDVS